MDFKKRINKAFDDVDKILQDGTSLPSKVRVPLRHALENLATACTAYDDYDRGYLSNSRKVIKSGYYDDPVNHPDGGGTCDYCGTEIAPGDGYESDFASSQDTAARYLFLALGGDKRYAYTVVENWHNFVQWLQNVDEDIDEDWLQDAVNDICRMAFGNSDGYMCSTCLDKTIKEAAEKWVEENW